ncbi:peptidase S8/S53 domain-containing protein [Gymnopilus junonius]|uniref:tripeptidyl-peptidase II n=1 Tax=Gymnopilus junonius TaxID=109634 RepID=A0A9P5NS89_GYMJU|nr:peptidase S8/S53 domain-containing protein [Gymnopilus junonius]
MLWSSIILLVAAQLCASTVLSRRWNDLAEKHSWVETPRGWQVKGPAPSNHIFELRIGLKQDGMDKLIENLMEISDPTHARYAQHLTKEETDAFLAPHADSTAVVEEWLFFHGIDTSSTQRSDAGDWIKLQVSVDQAERMLGTKYNVYQHEPSGEQVVRTLSYSLPKELHSHVDVVAPTTYFGTLRSMKKRNVLQPNKKPLTDEEAALHFGSDAAVPSSCADTITPTCLRDLYNTSTYTPTQTKVNELGIAGYLDEFANTADLQSFFKKYRKDAVGSSFSIVQVNGGGNDQSNPGVEANLDTQYTTAISFPTPNIYYSVGGSPPFIPDDNTYSNTNEPYLDLLNFLQNQLTIPQTLSTSYGDDEQTVPFDYATSVCNMFATLGSRGTTVFFSSGDYGVGGSDCLKNDGSETVLFQPDFPASCPFVTTVGATTSINPEVAASFSGGGFSQYFAAPTYQKASCLSAIADAQLMRNENSKTGRAYPDISAQGESFQVFVYGFIEPVDGTSASCPTAAAIFALLNDFRLSQGKTSLGFINPLIYSTASSGFTDITSGSNPGCVTDGAFTAGKGWDPVTGLGTPNFLKLQTLVV